jgi:glycosyltransferase involved in cell wall biosynthesis
MPAVSVLLPVRDAAPWLGSSLASLWRQSFRDFEVVAVDDGSRDGSGERLERAAEHEPRLRVIHTPPRGLPAALATAHQHARAPLLARHDADDLSHRDRLALQVAHLAAHPRVAVVGTRLRLFPAGAVRAGMRRWVAWHNELLAHEEMAREVLVESPLAHGSALLRARWVERAGGWTDRGWAEDVDLWVRLLGVGARFAKLPRVLYAWRQHAASATWNDPRYARARMRALRAHALERGLLAGARAVTLVGVGASLRGWRHDLQQRGIAVTALEQGRPPRPRSGPATTWRDWLPPATGQPWVLVFGAAPARRRWRCVLQEAGAVEGRDFVFVG